MKTKTDFLPKPKTDTIAQLYYTISTICTKHQKLFTARTKKTKHNTTTLLYSEVQTYFPPEQKTNTTAHLEMKKGSSSPHEASVFVPLSVCL
jgi:hypothetical protein